MTEKISSKSQRQHCPWCGRRMRGLCGPKAGEKSGLFWRCDSCMPGNMSICIKPKQGKNENDEVFE